MISYEIRVWSDDFQAAFLGKKRAEFRKADRLYQEGDELVLREWDPKRRVYLGRYLRTQITHVASGGEYRPEERSLPAGYVLISFGAWTTHGIGTPGPWEARP
jgi:hypothetical protein